MSGHQQSPAPGSPTLRELAAQLVERALATPVRIDEAVTKAAANLASRDAALLRELVRGTLTWLRRLDQVIEAASGRSMARIDSPLHAPLRIAAYQLFFLDRVPAHAAVNEAVEAARRRTHRGGVGFVNAVLRRLASASGVDDFPVEVEDPVERLAIEMSHPSWLVRRWAERLGLAQTRQVLEADNRSPSRHLLSFSAHGGRGALLEELTGEGLEVEPSPIAPQGIRVLSGRPIGSSAFAAGRLYLQNEASQLAALIPPPRADERVLDAAAAPGGKSFSLFALEPSIRCLAMDLSAVRVGRLRANVLRLGLELPMLVADASLPPLAADFDRVILDAPCSGTGTLRKNPELRWRLSPGEIPRLAEASLEMIRACAGLVAPGGVLQLVTCSLEPEENEDLLRRWLAETSESSRRFEPLPLKSAPDLAVAAGVVAPGVWRRWSDDHADGFTVAVARRREV